MSRIKSDDICIWADDSWCYGEELEEMLSWKSDDFLVLKFGTKDYCKFLEEHE